MSEANTIIQGYQQYAARDKNRRDVEYLKVVWTENPIWPLATTPGYSAFKEELEAFEAMHALRAKNKEAGLKKAKEAGLPDNVVLGNYLIELERRISDLEVRLYE